MEALIPIMIFSIPLVWIVMHYKYGGSRTSGFTEEETRQLHELLRIADSMADRIKTLESILDAEQPDWRQQDWREPHGKQ
jgi:phage shock protein B